MSPHSRPGAAVDLHRSERDRIALVSAIVDQLRASFLRRDDVELAVLFGSAAQGRLHATSDIDVAVRWTAGEPRDRDAFFAAVERAMGCPVDVIDLDVAPPQLRFEIARDGLLLVERATGAWSRTRARAFIDWWDFRPIAKIIHRAAIARVCEPVRGSR
jgi:uncharacterized protein